MLGILLSGQYRINQFLDLLLMSRMEIRQLAQYLLLRNFFHNSRGCPSESLRIHMPVYKRLENTVDSLCELS